MTNENEEVLRDTYIPYPAENKEPWVVTKEDYNSDEGDYFISISTNNIDQLRKELARLSYYYAIPREGEFYFETRK